MKIIQSLLLLLVTYGAVAQLSPMDLELFIDVDTEGQSAKPTARGNFHDQFIFEANRYNSNTELWITDGTKEGTYIMYDLMEDFYFSISEPIQTTADYIFFAAKKSETENGLFRSDGSRNATELLYTTEEDVKIKNFLPVESGVVLALTNCDQWVDCDQVIFYDIDADTSYILLDEIINGSGVTIEGMYNVEDYVYIHTESEDHDRLYLLSDDTKSVELIATADPSRIYVYGDANGHLFFGSRANDVVGLYTAQGNNVNLQIAGRYPLGALDRWAFFDNNFYIIDSDNNKLVKKSDGLTTSTYLDISTQGFSGVQSIIPTKAGLFFKQSNDMLYMMALK